jgi:hypothetical protein
LGGEGERPNIVLEKTKFNELTGLQTDYPPKLLANVELDMDTPIVRIPLPGQSNREGDCSSNPPLKPILRLCVWGGMNHLPT